MRCLGIDYGERRIGLSWGDELGVAVPLAAATQSTSEARLAHVVQLIRERRATDLVVGYPYNMDGSIGFKAREVDAFVEKLTALVPLPVHRVDERLSTRTATEHMSKRRDDAMRRSGKIDSMAASVILQDFLNQRLPPPAPDEPLAE
ncbi:MAG: Holliday junction resolvase RuvX [Opitutaceae bacterium]|nr:Holliday junction resolvase RuvX [Opitutaceae bacterium]